MKTLLGLGLLFVVVARVHTAETSGFAVDLVNPSRAYLLVDDAWQQNAECLQVKVSVQAEVSDPVLKAYFYSTDGKARTGSCCIRKKNHQGKLTGKAAR